MMNRHKILLVEDDLEIKNMLVPYLTTENYEMVCAADGEEACREFDQASFHLVLLDPVMPKISGIAVMQHIRKNSVVPIIIITKPFSLTEVLSRIKATIERAAQYGTAAPDFLTAGDLVMNLSDDTVTKNGKTLALTAKEFEILKLLLQHPKKLYTKEQIYSLEPTAETKEVI